ncbi:MAG: glycoside hydrolase, partial [Planctomycetes bacterium]|nr:glycoside hydrolase [Planctomycetota bacterium]
EFPDVASNGDLSAILYQDQATEGLFVTTSDGRGIEWSAPVRIDDKTGTTVNFLDGRETLHIGNGNIYACWRDERNSTNDDLYFTYSTDGGATWAANVEVDKGYPSGANPVREFSFDVDGDNGAILIATDNGDEELYLVTMAGGTLSSAISATSFNGAGDTDAIQVDVEGNTVHISFLHDASGVNQTYYSQYDLATGSFTVQDQLISPTVQSLGGDSPYGLSMHADGDTVAVAWDVDGINGSNDELWATVIQAGVAMTDVPVGNYPFDGSTDVDNPDVLMNGDVIIVAWEDNRSGSDNSYVASADSSSGSLSFTEFPISSGGAGFPAVNGGGDYVVVSGSAGGFPENVQAVASRDGGMTFGPMLEAAITGNDVDYAELAYNETYNNFVISLLDDANGSNECYAGGLRVQSVEAIGTFSAGSPVSFEASNFGASEDGQFFGLLASLSTGSLTAPDGRDLGLTADIAYSKTRGGIPGQFSGSLTAGMGSTSTFNLPNLPGGTTLYFVAIGFDSSANLYSLTDVNSVVTL